MNPRTRHLRNFGWLALALGLAAIFGCDPGAKAFRAGPFSGQVVDAETGQPVPGAFVGFRWSGQSAIHGSIPCLLAVLVQADSLGRYEVPWQGDRLETSGAVGVGWRQEVWAPGYVLLKTGEGNLLRAGIVKAARDPNVSVEQGVAETRQEQSVTVGNRKTVIPLQRVTSPIEALDMNNRLHPDFYSCGMNENTDANNDVQRIAALALYRDSYPRVCKQELPDEALTRRYLIVPDADFGRYRAYLNVGAANSDPNQPTNLMWEEFDYKAGWRKPISGYIENPPPFDRALLPELCRLQRFESALSGEKDQFWYQDNGNQP